MFVFIFVYMQRSCHQVRSDIYYYITVSASKRTPHLDQYSSSNPVRLLFYSRAETQRYNQCRLEGPDLKLTQTCLKLQSVYAHSISQHKYWITICFLGRGWYISLRWIMGKVGLFPLPCLSSPSHLHQPPPCKWPHKSRQTTENLQGHPFRSKIKCFLSSTSNLLFYLINGYTSPPGNIYVWNARVAKPCQPVDANFSRPVLIFGQST